MARVLERNPHIAASYLDSVEDVVWTPGSSRSDLPLAVLVSCPGITSPTLWRTEPRPDFPEGFPIIPIPPVKSTFEHGGKNMSRTQIPLRLAWAVTVHKSQGLTLKKVKLGLGKKEFASGLTFVGLSRVKTIDSLIIVGQFDYSRVKCLAGSNYQFRLEDLPVDTFRERRGDWQGDRKNLGRLAQDAADDEDTVSGR